VGLVGIRERGSGKVKEEKKNIYTVMIKMAVFWTVAPCSLVEVYQRFRGPCCLHHQGDRYNPEDSHPHTHRLDNLKSYYCNDIYL
jgi:hypothetical protein